MEMIRGVIEGQEPAESLKVLLELDNRLYGILGDTSIKYGKGLHSKHRHIGYHDFFVENLKPNERVLDIGSGNGALCYEMARRVPGVSVVGIELNEENIADARQRHSHPNLRFIHGDAGKDLPMEDFDVVTMSNVLEHIRERVEILKTIVSKSNPDRIILRVPLMERDWRVPLKKELGVEYRLDPTHCIEYTLESFRDEMRCAGLTIKTVQIRWGEIWTVLHAPGGRRDL